MGKGKPRQRHGNGGERRGHGVMVGGRETSSSGSTPPVREGNRDKQTREWLGEGERRRHRVMVGGGGETSSSAQGRGRRTDMGVVGWRGEVWEG